jgi:hypothetical protein
MDISSLFGSCSWYLKHKYRQPNIDRIHQRLLSVDCVRRVSSPAQVKGVLQSENLGSHRDIDVMDVIQYIHANERWKPTLSYFSVVLRRVLRIALYWSIHCTRFQVVNKIVSFLLLELSSISRIFCLGFHLHVCFRSYSFHFQCIVAWL